MEKQSQDATKQRSAPLWILKRYIPLSTYPAISPTYISQCFPYARHCDTRMEIYSSWIQDFGWRKKCKHSIMGTIFNQGSAHRVNDAQRAIYTCLVMVGKVPEQGKAEVEGRNRSLPELQGNSVQRYLTISVIEGKGEEKKKKKLKWRFKTNWGWPGGGGVGGGWWGNRHWVDIGEGTCYGECCEVL